MSVPDRRPRVCLVTFGSAGDVHPMLALGQCLRERGHAVTLLTSPVYAELAGDARLDFTPIGEPSDYAEATSHPKVWHPIDGFGVLWRYLLRPALVPTYEQLAEIASVEPCVVIASPVAMGARVAQEHLGVPLITAYTAATMLRTVHSPMTLAQWRVAPWIPRAARRLAWAALDHFKLDPLVRPALDALRGRLKLPRIEGPVFDRWIHSPKGGVTLFPSWFATAPPDWPRQVVQAGFPLYDGDAQQPVAPWLREFLEQGPPPVVFMPGTAQQNASAFYAAAVKACEATGQRGLLLGPLARDVAADTDAIRTLPYAPFTWLLPRARALVHHGGIGSCAQAMRAGIPQVLAPQAYDQFDNAMRLERLGVGACLPRGADGMQQMAAQLARLLASPDVAAACAVCAKRTSPQPALDVVAGLVERLA
ncbi:MAG: glycosyltransferase [Ramlibacter sp.]